MTKFEKSWNFYTNIIGLIKSSDNKAAAILATNGVVFGLIFRNIYEIMSKSPENNLIIVILIIIGIIAGIFSIIFCVWCLFPNVKNHKPAIFFFGHVVRGYRDLKDYNRDFIKTVSNDALLNLQISEQIWEVSQIALFKYEKVKWAMIFLAITVVFLLVPLGILFAKC